jgi:hypothetical protein
MKAGITSQSQTFRLVERMQEANIHHGQEIRADLPNIRVVALSGAGEGQALFCTMGPIRVREIMKRGDDRPLPSNVAVEGLEVPTSGSFDILNALVRSNGDLRLVLDDKTRVVPAIKVPERTSLRGTTYFDFELGSHGVTNIGAYHFDPRLGS